MKAMEWRKEQASWPGNIVIVGGGRWARVLTDVLCGLVPSSVAISVHSRHNIASMGAWAKDRGLEGRIQLSAAWPPSFSGSSNAVVVANAARDHAAAVEWALSEGIAVLVEKPMALTSDAANRLANLARERNVRFAPAHVFLFSRYIENFSKLIANAGEIQSLHVDWVDPELEERYGESKRYDPGVPVFSDWLPHIIPIVGVLLAKLPDSYRNLKVSRGGAAVEIELMAGDILCVIRLERNAERRKRVVQVNAGREVLQLDFSAEPGIIRHGASVMTGDKYWNSDKRPVACMLTAFLKWAACGEIDKRLDIGPGLHACRIIDQTAEEYHSALMPWLIAKLAVPAPVDDSLRYALSELLLAEGPLSAVELDRRIELVTSRFVGVDGARCARELADVRNVPGLINTLST